MKSTKVTWVCVSRTITRPETGPVEYQQWCKVVIRPESAAEQVFVENTLITRWTNRLRLQFLSLPDWGNSGSWNGIWIPKNPIEAIGFGGGYGRWFTLVAGADNHLGSKYNGYYDCVIDLEFATTKSGEPKAPHPDQVTRLEIAEDSLRNTLSIMRNAIKQIEDK